MAAVAAAIAEALIEGGVVRRDIATIDPKDAAITAAITRAMSWGAVTMHKDTLPTERGKKRANANDPALIDAAFTRFDAALSESALSKTALPKTTALIKELHLPKHGHSTLLVGAAVIRTVRDLNPTAFTELRAQGPLAVFAAYVEHCRKGEVPSSRRLSQALEEHIVRLSHAFTEAAPLSVRKLRKKDLKDVERTVALLSPMKGKDAHPDFTDDLVVASTSLLTARPRDAAALARLNVDLHPRSAIARLSLVEALLMLDDDDSARVLDDAWRRFGAASMPASLWLSRIVKLQHLASTGSARASVAAERLLHEAHKRFPNDATLVGDDDADEQ